MNANGTALVYCSKFGDGVGELWGVDVNPVSGQAFVAGYENPPTGTNPPSTTPGAYQVNGAGGMEAMAGRISADGSTLIYLTYLGGSNTDQALGIAVNSAGEAYISGNTNSPDFPVTACQYQTSYNANYDMFITHLSPQGDNLGLGGSGYYGGSWDDYFLPRIAVRDDGPLDTLFCCLTSHSPDFPTTPNAFQPVKLNTTGDTPTAFKLVVFDQTLIADTSNCSINSYLVEAPTLTQNILWSTGDTTSSITITQSGQYWLSGTIYNCSYSDTFNVVVNELSVDLGPDTSFCANTPISLSLSAGSGDIWLWHDMSNAPTVAINAPGTYWVTATDTNTGCTATDSLVIQSLPQPIVNLASPPLCTGIPINIPADPNNNYPGASYSWSTGDTTGQVTIGAGGWVWVDLTDNQGCTSRDSIFLVENLPPSIHLGPDTTICDMPSLTLDVGAGFANHLWSDNSTSQTATFSQPGWIWVEVTDTNGCFGQDSLLLELGTRPLPQLGPDLIVCEGESVTLAPQTSGSGLGYNWSNGASSPQVTVNQAGTYWVEVTELSSGCSGRDSVNLAVLPFPEPVLEDTLLCDQDSLVLNPGMYGTYLWSDSSTAPTLTVQTPGGYNVTVTTGNCSDSTGARVVFGNSPATDLGPDLDLCLEDRRTLFLTAESGNTVLWSNGSTDWSMDFPETGDYWAEITNECGTTRDSIRVTFAQEFIEPFIPNVFTPNGDGISDCFRIENPDVQSYFMQIFDRWGRLMYETQNINDCWNGLYRNRPAPAGAYVCIVRLRACNGELVTRSEMVTLVR
jgi:gliding motility-associated-like protein